jgi:hypothetical protein
VPAAGVTAGARRLRRRELELDRHLRRACVHGPDRRRRLRRELSGLSHRADDSDVELFDVERDRHHCEHDDVVWRYDPDHREHDDVVRRRDRHRDPAQRRHRHRTGHRHLDQRWGEPRVGVLSAEPRGVLRRVDASPLASLALGDAYRVTGAFGRASDALGNTSTLGFAESQPDAGNFWTLHEAKGSQLPPPRAR